MIERPQHSVLPRGGTDGSSSRNYRHLRRNATVTVTDNIAVVWVWSLLLATFIATGLLAGVLSPIALPAIAAFGALCALFPKTDGRSRQRQLLRAATGAAIVLFSLALMAHVVPGFSNPLVVRDVRLSPDALPYSLYLNFDKALIGLFLLAFEVPRLRLTGLHAWWTMVRGAAPRMLVVIAVAMAGALLTGHVRLAPKWPAFLPYWLAANLFITCAAEEALFRGFLQRHLGRSSPVMGLVVAAILFGLVHFAGGPTYVALSTVAGAGYGWIYWRTGRIEAAILTHFLVNLTHILFFTYPALRS